MFDPPQWLNTAMALLSCLALVGIAAWTILDGCRWARDYGLRSGLFSIVLGAVLAFVAAYGIAEVLGL